MGYTCLTKIKMSKLYYIRYKVYPYPIVNNEICTQDSFVNADILYAARLAHLVGWRLSTSMSRVRFPVYVGWLWPPDRTGWLFQDLATSTDISCPPNTDHYRQKNKLKLCILCGSSCQHIVYARKSQYLLEDKTCFSTCWIMFTGTLKTRFLTCLE